MARGGKRAGAPGRSYSNRTDLNVVRAPQQGLNTVAAAGVTPPDQPAAGAALPTQGGAPQAQGPLPVQPEQVTPLDAPSDRPHEPVTTGLPSGAGAGPDMMAGRQDLLAMKVHLPYLTALTQNPDTPASVVNFVNYLQSQVNRA